MDDEDDAPLSDLSERVGDGDADDGTRRATESPPPRDDGRTAAARRDDAPLSDLADRIERKRSDAARGDADSLFESVSVEEMDSETLWAGLVDGDGSVGTGASVESVDEEVPGYEDHVVPKAEFCQRCPHVADPPELACTHEGTEIVEVVDTDRFRVRNCPMVDED